MPGTPVVALFARLHDAGRAQEDRLDASDATGFASALSVIARGLPALVVALAATLALRRLDNTDTWWHLAAGRWIALHRGVQHLDVLSWTVPDHRWFNLQWLFELLIYGLYQLGGPSLLVIASATAYAGATALMLANIRRHAGPLLAAALGAWATVVSQERFAIRPEMLSFLLLQVVLWLYATGRRTDTQRLWLVPAVMCLWANSHALFIVGAVVVLCQMVGSLVTDLPLLPAGWRRPIEPAVRRRVLATGVAGLLATVVNPYGPEGTAFPLVLMSRINGDHPLFRTIGEFRRPFDDYFVTYSIRAYKALFVLGVVAVAAALLVAAIQRREAPEKGRARARRRRTGGGPEPAAPALPFVHMDLADVAVFAGLAYLSLLARRNMALFAMGGAPCLASALVLLGTRLPERVRAATGALRDATAGVVAIVLVVAIGVVASNRFYRWNGELHEFGLGTLDVIFPVRAAEFMRTQGLPRPLFNDFTNGGYLSWADPLSGGVYIDGRTEVYDVDFLGPYMSQVKDPNAWEAEMERRGVQTVLFFHWWPNHQALVRHLVRDPRWALVYYDETSILLVRRAGNDAVIARATAAFADERQATERMLLAPVPGWGYPVGRERALVVYTQLLGALGKPGEARPFQERLRELDARG